MNNKLNLITVHSLYLMMTSVVTQIQCTKPSVQSSRLGVLFGLWNIYHNTRTFLGGGGDFLVLPWLLSQK